MAATHCSFWMPLPVSNSPESIISLAAIMVAAMPLARPLTIAAPTFDFLENVPESYNEHISAAGYASYCLTPDGKLTLCPSFPSVIGDLKMSSFIDVLNSPHLAFGKKAKRSDYKECGQKDYCKFCAPCPGLNYTKSGSPFVPSENNCYLAKMRKEVADMLKAGSDPLDGASSIEEALCRLPMYTNNHIEITKQKVTMPHGGTL